MIIEQMNSALDFLRDKYGVGPGLIAKGQEYFQLVLPDGSKVELLPHRVERRFVELKKIIDGKTLEGVSTFRFAAFRPNGELRKICGELDLPCVSVRQRSSPGFLRPAMEAGCAM